MTRTLITLTALICLSSAYSAFACDTELTLSCKGTYLASGKPVLTGAAADHLADENWDEPSEANCAATIYLSDIGMTSVRIRGELEGSQLSYTAEASQVYRNDQNEEEAFYSNTLSARDKVGNAVSLGVIHLANPISYGPQMTLVTDVAVTCVVR